MPGETNPPNEQGIEEERIDDETAALEESDEEREENRVVEEADANVTDAPSMQEFDVYTTQQEPSLGLYVRAGSALPDFANSKQWIFYRTVAEDGLSTELVQQIKADGHAFQKLG